MFFIRERHGKSAFRAVSAVTVAGFPAVITLSEQSVLDIPGDTLYMWTILAAVLMTSVVIFKLNRQFEMEKELAKLKSEQAELLERDYTTLNRAYEVNAKLFHDLILTAASFALLSAAGSVLLEWYCPIRGWKIERDLWHHPRKYVVPAGMLLLAGLAGLF